MVYYYICLNCVLFLSTISEKEVVAWCNLDSLGNRFKVVRSRFCHIKNNVMPIKNIIAVLIY